jgi:hypothetical protein
VNFFFTYDKENATLDTFFFKMFYSKTRKEHLPAETLYTEGTAELVLPVLHYIVAPSHTCLLTSHIT